MHFICNRSPCIGSCRFHLCWYLRPVSRTSQDELLRVAGEVERDTCIPVVVPVPTEGNSGETVCEFPIEASRGCTDDLLKK